MTAKIERWLATGEAARRLEEFGGGYIIDTQFDKVNYYPRVSPTVTTRFDANNCEFYIEPIERKEMETIMERETKEGGVLFKGREVHHGEGLYTDTTEKFFRGGLPGVSRCIKAGSADAGVCLAEPRIIQLGNTSPTRTRENPNQGRTYDPAGLSPTLNAAEGGGRRPQITETGSGGRPRFRIRKLTEREAFRLMDVSEADIDKIQAAGISRSQQYKMAGNSICVCCLYYIFENLFCKEYDNNVKETLF